MPKNVYKPYKTTEQFIHQLKEIHGDKYDYSKVEYTRMKNKVTIICKKCGINMEQRADTHLKGHSPCHKCPANKMHSHRKHRSWLPFNDALILVHSLEIKNNKEWYAWCKKGLRPDNIPYAPQSVYKDEGWLGWGHWLNTNNVKNMPAPILNKNIIINKLKEIYGNKYDYSKIIDSTYISKSKFTLICKKHGEFIIGIRNKVGCKRCHAATTCTFSTQSWEKITGRKKMTTELFIKESKDLFGDYYDYSKTIYVSQDEKVSIICKEHGEFKIFPRQHTTYMSGCKTCAKIEGGTIGDFHSPNKVTTCDWIKRNKIKFGDKYDYSKVQYTSSKNKVTIICKKHGEFQQDRHMGGCHKCLLCPTCELWRTLGGLCRYCNPNSKKGKQLRGKTKEMEIVKYLRGELPDDPFYHNESVGSDCTKDDRENTNGHLYPDVRFDCDTFQLIVEIDEFRHRGSHYKCDERRMYDIIAKLGMRCVFIRYNPDSAETNKTILLKLVKKYLQNPKIEFNSFGLKTEYLFY